MANCYACKAEIVFDNEHVGRNGKKIPLDPATKQPHDCPMREKKQTDKFDPWSTGSEDKNDHGNELVQGYEDPKILTEIQQRRAEYVDHTLKGQSKVKIFFGLPDDLAQEYNEFLWRNNGKIKTQGAQFQLSNTDDQSTLFAIALYYEEVAK